MILTWEKTWGICLSEAHLNIIISSRIYFPTSKHDFISLYRVEFHWNINHLFFIHSSVDRHLGWTHNLVLWITLQWGLKVKLVKMQSSKNVSTTFSWPHFLDWSNILHRKDPWQVEQRKPYPGISFIVYFFPSSSSTWFLISQVFGLFLLTNI